jgi:hypothetical protein
MRRQWSTSICVAVRSSLKATSQYWQYWVANSERSYTLSSTQHARFFRFLSCNHHIRSRYVRKPGVTSKAGAEKAESLPSSFAKFCDCLEKTQSAPLCLSATQELLYLYIYSQCLSCSDSGSQVLLPSFQ